MQQCKECKFAKWKLTDAGRKHPSGMGECAWKKVVVVAATTYHGAYKENGSRVVLEGGRICRKKGEEYPNVKCDVFQPIKKG